MEEKTMEQVEMEIEATVDETAEPMEPTYIPEEDLTIGDDKTEVYDAVPVEEQSQKGGAGLVVGLAIAAGTGVAIGACVLGKKVIAPVAGKGIRALGRKMADSKLGKKAELERKLKKEAKKAKKELEYEEELELDAEETPETFDAEPVKEKNQK